MTDTLVELLRSAAVSPKSVEPGLFREAAERIAEDTGNLEWYDKRCSWDARRIDELEAKLSELEAERARWELRASFLAVEAIDEYWMQSELKADPTEDDSPWVGRLDALIEESWPHAIRDNREG